MRVMLLGRAFIVTVHAYRRYRERVRPLMPLVDAARELHDLLESDEARITLTVPEWARSLHLVTPGTLRGSDEYIEIESRQLLFPVSHGKLTTCLAKRVGAQVRVRGGVA